MARQLWLRFVVLVFLASAFLPREAAAHAVLLASAPASDIQLAESPKEVTLSFNENVGPIIFKVLDKTGKEVGKPSEIRLDGNSLHLALNETLPNGTYIVTYRVVSADTHLVAGTLLFGVGEAVDRATSIGQLPVPAMTGWKIGAAANRFVLYVAMVLAAGSALFLLAMTTNPAAAGANARLGFAAALLGAFAFVLTIGLGGAEMLSGGPDVLLSDRAWSQGSSTTLLPSAAIGVPAMVLLMIGFSGRRRRFLLIGAVLAIGSFLVTGHAATAAPVWLMAAMVGVHLACAAFWLGALRPLYVVTTEGSMAEAGKAMVDFSRLAVLTVAALLVSGVVLTWVQVETPRAMIETHYGLKLIAKIVVFAMLLGLAAYNKLVLTPGLVRADVAATARLRRTILTEYVLYVVVLALAASLTLTPPPRALKAAGAATMNGAPTSFRATVKSEGYTADIDVTPAKPGENMIMVTVRDKTGAAIKLESMELRLALPGAGVTEVEKRGQAAGPDMWHFMVAETIIPGEWEVKVSAFVNAFDKVDFDLKVPIN